MEGASGGPNAAPRCWRSNRGARCWPWKVQACASAEGLWLLTIAGAWCTRSSSSSASTMNRAKSTRRVMSRSRMASPTWRAPDRQALAGALLQAAAPHDGPARVAGEHASRRLDPVVEVGEAGKPGEAPAHIDQGLELPRVDVLAVERDVPPAREHQPRPRLGVVEHRLRGPGRVPVHAARDEHDEDSVAAGDGPLDDAAVVGRARHDGDPPVELGELGDALLAADGDDLVPAVERVPDHVGTELAGSADDADPHGARSGSRSVRSGGWGKRHDRLLPVRGARTAAGRRGRPRVGAARATPPHLQRGSNRPYTPGASHITQRLATTPTAPEHPACDRPRRVCQQTTSSTTHGCLRR